MIDSSRDARRVRKRDLDDVFAKNHALSTILDTLRSADNDSVESLMRLIRNDATVNEIAERAQDVVSANTLLGKYKQQPRQAGTDFAAWIDEPPIQVKADPWTTATDDVGVSHLLSVYFTWHSPSFPGIDKDILIRHISLQDESSHFCSPFLVNAVLLMASVYTDHPAAFADPSDPSTRGLHFMEEAERLWRLEAGRVSLTNLQALPSMIVGAAVLAKDRLSLMYCSEMSTVDTQLVQRVKKSLRSHPSSEYASEDYQCAFRLAVWGSFVCQVTVAIVWLKPFHVQKPLVQYPYRPAELPLTQVWTPDSSLGKKTRLAAKGVCHERFKLHEVGAEMIPLLLSGKPDDTPLPGHIILDRDVKLDRLHVVLKNLRTWHDNLPTYARIERSPSAPPAVVDLHLVYHMFCVNLWGIAVREHGQAPNAASQAEKVTARRALLAACQDMAQLFQHLQETIGVEQFPSMLVQAATTSSFTLLNHFSQPGVPDIFHTVIVSLSAACRRWMIARGILKMVWITLQERHLDSLIHDATRQLFETNAVNSWATEDHLGFVASVYPNYAAVEDDGREMADMGELLEKYSRLQIARDAEVSEPRGSRPATSSSSLANL